RGPPRPPRRVRGRSSRPRPRLCGKAPPALRRRIADQRPARGPRPGRGAHPRAGGAARWRHPQSVDPYRQHAGRYVMRRWPLFLIAAPAAVAVWSGWVGLGELCGFGPVNLLPGIGGGFHLNTAITLPVGVEAYGAYALGAWLTPGTPERARSFARRSAVGALALGMLGQVVYHLLAAAGATPAPW